MKPLLGLSLMPEPEFVSAILPLLQANKIDVFEWSFDTAFDSEEPEWLSNLLDFYSSNDRLLGHGVYYSLFDAKWTIRQNEWLEKLKIEVQKRNYNHVTEHFGFMNTENFHQGIPLPVSLNSKTLQIGVDRISRLQDALDVPVGIENLAFAFSVNDVKEQGDFLNQLTESVGGFLLLDLHNIYCQSQNFGVNLKDLIDSYPLEKVQEIHLSGGSWQESIYSKNKLIRRDTHDDSIPEEVFLVLPYVFSKCKNLKNIIIERLGNTMNTDDEKLNFINDYHKVLRIIEETNFPNQSMTWEKRIFELDEPLEDHSLYEEQCLITKMLFEQQPANLIKQQDFTFFDTERWDPEMIATATEIIKKWNPY